MNQVLLILNFEKYLSHHSAAQMILFSIFKENMQLGWKHENLQTWVRSRALQLIKVVRQ